MSSPSPPADTILLPQCERQILSTLHNRSGLLSKENIFMFFSPIWTSRGDESLSASPHMLPISIARSGVQVPRRSFFTSFYRSGRTRRVSRHSPCSHSRVRRHICDDRSTFCRSPLSPNRCLLDVGVGQSNPRLLPPSPLDGSSSDPMTGLTTLDSRDDMSE